MPRAHGQRTAIRTGKGDSRVKNRRGTTGWIGPDCGKGKTMAICKGCGQAIFFVKMQGTGKKMPCDFTPVYYEDTERGTHTIITPDGRTSKGRIADDRQMPEISSAMRSTEREQYPHEGDLRPLRLRKEAIVFSEEGSKHKGYMSHFATCPAAGDFRKKMEAKEKQGG